MDYDKINCRHCGKCNRKGLPSVMKGSKMCVERRGFISPERKSVWSKVKFNLQTMFFKKGTMRKSGARKQKGDEDAEEQNT